MAEQLVEGTVTATLTKIKAKCKTCKRRLWTDNQDGPFCKNGHKVTTTLVFRFEKKGAGPKRRRIGGGKKEEEAPRRRR